MNNLKSIDISNQNIKSIIKGLRHISHDKNMMRTYGGDSMTKSELLCRAADLIEQLSADNNTR